MKIESGEQDCFYGWTYRVRTPDGTMFVTIMEDDQLKPCGIHIHLGKSGGSAYAWAQALARSLTLALDKGAGINDLIAEISMQTTDKVQVNGDGVTIRSGIEGVAYILMEYRREKYREHLAILKGSDEDHRAGRLAS